LIVMNDLETINAATLLAHPDLRPLISTRIDELAEYGVDSIHELVNIIVIEPWDTIQAIDEELGFDVLDRPVDVIECHPHWYELTYVLGDDGFGIVMFIPVEGVTPPLLDRCRQLRQDATVEF
jgi:hypothetical protein